jgi:hypothetical protein
MTSDLLLKSLSFFLEELLHELAALVLEDAGSDSATGMESVGGKIGIAALGIATAKDNAWNLTPSESSSTHGAGFHSDVEGAVGKVFAA